MRRHLSIALCLLIVATPLAAGIGTIDVTPAATLLLPYFEVDPANPDSVDTLLTITNASASALVANVVLWTDYGIPTGSFTIYMTGYDQETISLAEAMNRYSPPTADAGDDPGDTSSPFDGISNKGDLSQDINFPGLMKKLSECTPPNLHLVHMGISNPDFLDGLCAARYYGDGRARGYVTVDSVTMQTSETPVVPGYFTGIADMRNIMIGEVTVIDRTQFRVYSEPAVHIEAYTWDVAVPAGTPTFYGRFVSNTSVDRREALPTVWGGAWNLATDVVYWRDPGVTRTPFTCGSAPLELGQRQARAYTVSGAAVGSAPAAAFPLASGVANLRTTLGLVNQAGTFFLNLNLPSPAFAGDNMVRQSWVTVRKVSRDAGATSAMAYDVHGVALGDPSNGTNPVKP